MCERKYFFKTIFSQKKEYLSEKGDVFDKNVILVHKQKWRNIVSKNCNNETEFSIVWDFFNDGTSYQEMRLILRKMGNKWV